MQVLFTGSGQLRTKIVPRYSRETTHRAIRESMKIKSVCPCCSNILLRHARSREIYWRCSHCYQEMPA